MIEVVKYEAVEIADTEHHVDIRKLFESDNVSVLEIKLNHGQEVKKHTAPVETFFYVIEGQGVISVGDEEVHASPDMLVVSPQGMEHGIINEGDEPMRFLVVKAPKP